ncbi:MAG: antibiotic biosynthesis monooxygenase [Spirochaetes bacterium]|nr:antibiotic biosynthesis monooxygenase [Spirochaetota bacterium]
MINVIASVKVKNGKKSEYIEGFKLFAEKVIKENGCIEYYPAVDMKTDFPVQSRDENVVTIIEKWESMESLMTHLATPEMQQQQEKEKDMVEGAEIKILQEA